MPDKLTIDVSSDGWTKNLQLSISRLDEKGSGTGYRLAGPKLNGSSKPLLSHELDENDARRIRAYLDAVFPQQHASMNAERLAKIEDRAAITRRELDAQGNASPAAILLANVDVPDLIAEVKRLSGELTKYVGWEPTVKEEYEHACGQLANVTKVVEGFAAGDRLAVNQFVADLKNALEI